MEKFSLPAVADAAEQLIPPGQPIGRFKTITEMRADSQELADKHPDYVRHERHGPLDVLFIGMDPDEPSENCSLIYGAPHANEPIGSITAEKTAQALCTPAGQDFLGRSGAIIVKVADEFGYAANSLAHDDLSLRSYVRGFYRQPQHEQVEWANPRFSGSHTFLSLNQAADAMRRIIERYRPTAVSSNHNMLTGMAYTYLTEEHRPLFPYIQRQFTAADIPLLSGHNEDAPWATEWAEGIYEMHTADQAALYLRKLGRSPTAFQVGGESFLQYAQRQQPHRQNMLGILCEVPRFTAVALQDTSVADRSIGDIQAEMHGFYRGTVLRSVDKVLAATPSDLQFHYFARALRWYRDLIAPGIQGEPEASNHQTPSVQMAFEMQEVRKLYGASWMGLAVRLAKQSGELQLAADIDGLINHTVEAVDTVSPIEIHDPDRLACVQAVSGLIAIKYHGQRLDYTSS